ncbi:MAG: hypothetical protein ABFS45_27810 [Pseudomonadota bacterium]
MSQKEQLPPTTAWMCLPLQTGDVLQQWSVTRHVISALIGDEITR